MAARPKAGPSGAKQKALSPETLISSQSVQEEENDSKNYFERGNVCRFVRLFKRRWSHL